tara:strand:+ start:445 stop:678 length:234 start_codon:yes stop_codon:yes gene_type:complete
MNEPTEIGNFKDWMTLLGAVVACVAGAIFWVQSSSDPKFEKIEKDITVLRQDIKNIRAGNSEILRIVGRLEGKLENH